MQACERPFRDSVGTVYRGRVGGFDEVLRDDVDAAFFGFGEVF